MHLPSSPSPPEDILYREPSFPSAPVAPALSSLLLHAFGSTSHAFLAFLFPIHQFSAFYHPGSALFVTFGVSLFLSIFDPRTLNRVLRYLILLFNSIYPFNSLASLFWLAIPPWLCFSGKFPFRLDASDRF